MGQAWCKEKSSKAQDSKSPLDRVFVRCAHSIYPGLKEEGSVLGGATQRVTSSEIGYAGSPPRSALLRGQSIDSVDRPFHPSDWVDVNLEVPCTPRASVVLTSVNLCPVRQQRTSQSNCSKGSKDGTTPVPPPRKRKRREKRPLPPKPSDGADEESEPDPLYSKLAAPRNAEDVNASTETLEDTDNGEHAAEDSDEEFAEIERTLQEKGSPRDAASAKRRLQQRDRARPKNHSTTSLPNVVELTTSAEELQEYVAAAAATTRPPRHAKTASLPRDAALFPPQTPERIFFGRTAATAAAAAAARRPASSEEDNSISKIDASPDASLTFEADVKTSTPVKSEAATSRSSNDLDDVFESFQDESSKSRDSSSRQGAEEAEVPPRPASPAAAEAPRRNEDLGYESRGSGSHLFSDGSNDESACTRTAELSSGILRDATPDSCDPDRPENPMAALQRTISEESLPREMLLEELEEEDEAEQRQPDGEKSAKDASNQLARQISAVSEAGVTFGTPPPSPEPKVHTSCASSSSQEPSLQQPPASTDEPADSAAKNAAAEGSGGDSNLTSMTPSLMELEAALTSMLEKKDEQEREQSEAVMWSKPDKSADVSPEPQIVPVKLNRSADEEQQQQRQAGEEDLGKLSPQPAKSRLIDFPRTDRTNPFNDLKSDDSDLNSSADDPPEKPSRLHRISLSEDSPLSEPLIVPTPPRRRHRSSKSGLNSSSLSCSPPVPLHTFAGSHGSSGDRLI